MQLDYKGFKSTRLVLSIIGSIAVTIAFGFGHSDGGVTAEQWLSFLRDILYGYGLSEVAIKTTVAVKDGMGKRNNDQ